MLIAEIKGKLPSKLMSYEDLLTSSVLGSLKYLSSPSYIQLILQSSVNNIGKKIFFHSDLVYCDYKFWPRLTNSEPDLLLHLRDTQNEEYIICIEAKYWSGKSSEEDTTINAADRKNSQRDQLAREIEDIHTDLCLNLFNVNKNKIKKTLLIYLTNDTTFPFDNVSTSAKHIQNIDYPITEIYWLTWSEIYKTITEFATIKTQQDAIILEDIKKLMQKKDLNNFSGLENLKDVPLFNFNYKKLSNSTSWTNLFSVEKVEWSYGGINNECK